MNLGKKKSKVLPMIQALSDLALTWNSLSINSHRDSFFWDSASMAFRAMLPKDPTVVIVSYFSAS